MLNLPPGIALSRLGADSFPGARPAPVSQDGTHRFQHFAMACPWSLWIAEAEFDYAARLAQEIWDEVERIEAELSRFIVSSDIYRLNAAQRQGQSDWLEIGSDAWECLFLGLALSELTHGAFDIGLGETIETRRGAGNLIREVTIPPSWDGPWCRYMQLDENPLRARLTDTRVQIDLGAIGKGYALDKVTQLLRDWGLQKALFSAGQSTVLGFVASSGAPTEVGKGWPVELRRPEATPEEASSVGRVWLKNKALSGSAQVLQGGHIIDGRTGKTASNWRATWAVAPTAALSDACSTAFMAMNLAEIQAFCAVQVHVGALLLDQSDDWHRCGVDVWEIV